MSGTKIKNFTVAPGKGTAGTDYFAAFKPADKNNVVRSWNVKMFSVHFLRIQYKAFRNAFCDRMSGIAAPKTFLVAFSPFQRAAGSHQEAERLAHM